MNIRVVEFSDMTLLKLLNAIIHTKVVQLWLCFSTLYNWTDDLHSTQNSSLSQKKIYTYISAITTFSFWAHQIVSCVHVLPINHEIYTKIVCSKCTVYQTVTLLRVNCSCQARSVAMRFKIFKSLPTLPLLSFHVRSPQFKEVQRKKYTPARKKKQMNLHISKQLLSFTMCLMPPIHRNHRIFPKKIVLWVLAWDTQAPLKLFD